MDFKTVWKKEQILAKLEKEKITDKAELVEKLLKALETSNTDADKKLEELADCCKEKDINVR